MKQTFKQANYTHIKALGYGQHIVKDNKTALKELFAANKNFNGWGLIYKNTHLEFVRGLETKELMRHNVYNS